MTRIQPGRLESSHCWGNVSASLLQLLFSLFLFPPSDKLSHYLLTHTILSARLEWLAADNCRPTFAERTQKPIRIYCFRRQWTDRGEDPEKGECLLHGWIGQASRNTDWCGCCSSGISGVGPGQTDQQKALTQPEIGPDTGKRRKGLGYNYGQVWNKRPSRHQTPLVFFSLSW